MPTRERSLGRSVLGSPTETPSTVIVPFWNGSSALTVLMSVDLPLPEGPHTTTTSPLATSVEQSVRTWKLPYHLLTFLMLIMLFSPDDGNAVLQVLHEGRQTVRDDEVHHGGEAVHLHQPIVAVG